MRCCGVHNWARRNVAWTVGRPPHWSAASVHGTSAVPWARMSGLEPRPDVVLAPYCTLGVGGPARWFVEASDEAALFAALDWANARGVPLRVLGGGSNLVVADSGIDAVVVRMDLRGVTSRAAAGAVELT